MKSKLFIMLIAIMLLLLLVGCERAPLDSSTDLESSSDLDNDYDSSEGTSSAPTKIEISPSEVTLVEGKKRRLELIVTPSDAENVEFFWVTSKDSVATVSNDGVVTAKKTGKATITAIALNGLNATCEVTVVSNDADKPNTGSDPSTDTGVLGPGWIGSDTDYFPDYEPDYGTNAEEEIDSIKDTFKGQTINILAPGLWASATQPSSPWGQIECCVTEYGGTAGGFGQTLNDAVMDREIAVEEKYDVTLNWINAKGDGVKNDLLAAYALGDVSDTAIHVAMPRTYEAQTVAYSELVYNIAGSKYIDFDASYYNQESIEQYTLAGNQFFIGGDMSFLDEHTSHVIFVNMSVAEEVSDFPDLFEEVLPGEDGKITWTIDRLYELSAGVAEDKDGNKDEWTDSDKYGFGTLGLYSYYQYFGSYQVGKTQTNVGEKYVLTIKNDNVEEIISKMLYSADNEDGIRTTWKDYGTLQRAFEENRLLFYREVIQKLGYLNKPEYKVAIVPFPKLNEEQDRYYVPIASQSTVMCVPRTTDNRAMSEAFVEILTKSASIYIFNAYKDVIESNLSYEYAEQSMQVIEEQIFPNLMYDLGYMDGFGGLVSSSIQQASIEGGKNVFTLIYDSAANQATNTLNEWTGAYNSYVDE